MNEPYFPIEFNNEVNDVDKSENETYNLAVDRLNKIAAGHTDISGAVVNLKVPAAGHETTYIYEVTIVLYMGSDHIAATEKNEQLLSALSGALGAVERQVHERRTQERDY